jgi:hypothetical protein
MTPKEKAQELFDKYNLSFAGVISNEEDWEFLAKQCALIAVDELIEQHKPIEHFLWSGIGYLVKPPIFWEQVKHEIENI